MTDAERFELAAGRWAAALSDPHNADKLAVAVADDVEIARYGFGARRGVLRQTISGREAVATWIQLTPAETVFEVDGAVTVADLPTRATCRYRLKVKDFEGAGQWAFSLAEDGRIQGLEHRPDEIEDPAEEYDWASETPDGE